MRTFPVHKYNSLIMLSTVSSKGMLVDRLSTSKLAIRFLQLSFLTSLANENESWTVYSFSVKGFKITRSLAKSYIVMSIADRMGRKDGQFLFSG